MAGFGKRPWGSSPFGSLTSGITGVPESKEPTETPVFGVPDGTGTLDPARVLSLSEFEQAIRFGDSDSLVNFHHVSAYVESFTPEFGEPLAVTNVLKAKTWSASATYQAYEPPFVADFIDLGAIIKAAGTASADLTAYVFAFGAVNVGDPVNLAAQLQPLVLDDLPALLAAVEAANLSGSVEAIPGFNLPAQADPVPGVNLSAIGGGHFPEDVTAYLAAVLPVNLTGYIRGGFSDTLDLGGSLIQIGQFESIPALINAAQRGAADLAAEVGVIVQGIKNLLASLQPYNIVELTASIITQRIKDMRAIVKGFAPDTLDLPASIARIDSASFDIQAHTIAQFIELTDIAGKIRIIQLGGNDVPSSLTAVLPFYNVSKIPLQFYPLTNLDAELNQTGGHESARASIRPVHRSSTGTADDSGFSVTASSYRFYLGTSRGLFIPPQTIPQVRVSTFRNDFLRPDLHATITAWNQSDLSATISVYPYMSLPAELRVISLDFLSNLTASVTPLNLANLSASLTTTGAFVNLGAAISTAGLIDDLGATLVPFVDPLASKVISVSTQPIANLGALINYDSYVKCSSTTFISSLGAYIKPLVTGTPANINNISASITSSLVALDMAADIVGKKTTRIRILNLTFTAKNRGSERIRGSITPLHHVSYDLAAEIRGLLHEVNLSASITPKRYQMHDVDFTAVEKVVNFSTGEIKDILLSFRSQVQHYVYEEVTDAVYSTDRGTWAIDLRTLSRAASFFDRAEDNRELVLDQLQEFYSLDEAIRAAVVVLCERRQYNLSASLVVRGAIADMGAQVTAFSAERVYDLNSKIMPVVNLPDISAAINTGVQSSGFAAMVGIITPKSSQVLTNISGEIFGDISTNLTAEITAT